MQRIKNFSVGLLMGAGIGAVASVLLAPDAGKTLRHRLRLHYQEAVREGVEAAEDRRQELEKKLAALTTPPPDPTGGLTTTTER